MIFWNTGGLGWSIGKTAYLVSGSYWHSSGLDSEEPWQGEWEKNVIVECVEEKHGDLMDDIEDDKLLNIIKADNDSGKTEKRR